MDTSSTCGLLTSGEEVTHQGPHQMCATDAARNRHPWPDRTVTHAVRRSATLRPITLFSGRRRGSCCDSAVCRNALRMSKIEELNRMIDALRRQRNDCKPKSNQNPR